MNFGIKKKGNTDEGTVVTLVERKRLVSCNDSFKDWMLFNRNKPKLFIDYLNKGNETKTCKGGLVISNTKTNTFKNNSSFLKNHTVYQIEINEFSGRN